MKRQRRKSLLIKPSFFAYKGHCGKVHVLQMWVCASSLLNDIFCQPGVFYDCIILKDLEV